MSKSKYSIFPNFSKCIPFFYSTLVILLAIGQVLDMLYSPKWRNEKGLFVFVFGFPIFNILVFLASLLLIWILKKILNALFGFCHLTNERKWRIWLGIGYIGCLLFGFLPRIRALWAGDLKGDLLITINVSMLCAFGIIIFYCFFLSPAKKSLKIFFNLSDYLFWTLLITQLVIMIINLIYGISLKDSEKMIMIMVCELAFSPVFCYSTLEFLMIWRGNYEFENTENQGEEMQKFNDLENGENSGNLKLECKRCDLGYSTYRTPRILKECGHTICEKCIEQILEQAGQKLEIDCAFCQKLQ
ncbi:hypothetical protein L5515_003364 [Caenorhabditis briggsae]|uniref:RING-type domain-containing protein n=1 Tax=Caenorhabditis briggsae TaxID=6238 RepID=A0AAE9JAS5_CAEBR|nr:hypothetical protein L5515_003364 [Caenorhabditis briggsae]